MTVNLKAPLKKSILNVPGFRFLTFGAKIKLKNIAFNKLISYQFNLDKETVQSI